MKNSHPQIQREKSSPIFEFPGIQSALPPFDTRGLSEISFFLESRGRPRPPPKAIRPSCICCTFFYGSKYCYITSKLLENCHSISSSSEGARCRAKSTFEHEINDRHESIVSSFRELRSKYLQRKRDLNEKQLSCPSPPVRSCYSRSLLARLSFSYY